MEGILQELFKAVRSHSDATTWSKGVELSRQGSVLGKSWKEEEILLLVLINEKSINPQVTLWPHEEDWNCDCGSQLDPCEHVAAAVIAIHQAQKSGKQLPQSDMEISTIEYHFSSQEDQQLAFKRLACNPHYCEALVVDLTALKSGRVKGPNIAPSKVDITIDYLIDGHRKGGVFPAHLMSSLIKSLRDSHNVYLDGKKISCDQNELRAPVKIIDHIACKISNWCWKKLYAKRQHQKKD